MNTSSRFIVATHILTILGGKEKYFPGYTGMNSEELAESVNTNPVVIRRILGQLKQSGLVISKTGPRGGTHLNADPEKISLAQIYDAVEGGDLFHLHYAEPNQICPVGGHIQESLKSIFNETHEAMRERLSHSSLIDVINDTLKRAGILNGENLEVNISEIDRLQQLYQEQSQSL